MPGHFIPPEANLYYTMVFILPAEILFSVLTYVGIGTLTSYLKLLMFQPPQLRQHSHLPTRPTPNSNGNINTIAHSILCIYPINLSSSHSHRENSFEDLVEAAKSVERLETFFNNGNVDEALKILRQMLSQTSIVDVSKYAYNLTKVSLSFITIDNKHHC